MIQKRKTCLYCGEEMESVTAKKKFCSDLHRVYWNREKKFEKELTDVLKENGIAISETINDLNTIGIAITKTENGKAKRVDPLSREGQDVQSKVNEPKENSMAFFSKYGCMTWAEVKAKK